MSKGSVFAEDFLRLIFNGTAVANIADNAGSSPLTNLYVSLHTGDVGTAGSQTTNEATYTSYSRAAVPRYSAGWAVDNDEVVNADVVGFPQCTGGSNTITHFAIGTASSGAGKVLYYAELDSPLAVSNNITPRFVAGTLKVTEE